MPLDPRVLRFWYETEVLAMPRVPVASGQLPAGPDDEPGYAALGPGVAPPWPVAPVVDDREATWVAHHYVYLGLFRHADALAELLRLLETQGDDPDRMESRLPADVERSSGDGCLAAFAVDHLGAPVPRSFVLASLPWALGRLRTRSSLRGFQKAGGDAAARHASRWHASGADEPDDDRVRTAGGSGEKTGTAAGSGQEDVVAEVCLTADDLLAEIAAVTEEIGWTLPPHPVGRIAVVRRSWRHEKTDAADDDVVNSFYLDDLERVETAVTRSAAGPALRSFLEPADDLARTDIWRDDDALAAAVRPDAVPAARWPAPGLAPQSLMQQAAIDLAMERLLPRSGLFSINGPPGTGKTTLLRDVIAAVVSERARRMLELERPEDAFEDRERVSTGGGRTQDAWRVAPELRGFEMVVASSINGAVENVTSEIPGVETIDEAFRPRLDYFAEVASSLTVPGRQGGAAWGLIAAVLGNQRNRRRFTRGVWFQEPTLRRALTAERAPGWDQARAGFRKALEAERRHRERAILVARATERTASPLGGAAGEAAARALDDARRELAGDAGRALGDADFWDRPLEERQRMLPWVSAAHDRSRAEVFVAAMALHRAFAAARPLRDNLGLAINLISGRLDPGAELAADLWTSLFLVVPVVSTTFASFARLFRGLGRETLGWLFIDEAGQAQPAHAVGAMWRARRAVVIGDPRQIPPVVTLPEPVYGRLRERSGVDASWDPTGTSVQVIADRSNPIGARLEDGTWLGCPLRVHRRCVEPMFDISNAVAYDGLMVSAVAEQPSPVGDVLGPTRWIDVRGLVAEEHWIDAEGEAVVTLLDPLLREAFVHGRRPDVFVISPFRSVATRARRLFRQHVRELSGGRPPPAAVGWLESGIGTIHTFQGKEAEAVVLLLGGNPGRPGAIRWAGEAPNILNVAVTRARLRLYVIGNRALWRRAGFFQELDRRMPAG